MNKRQKKKLYKKLHGHNPPKEPKKQLPEPQLKQAKDTVKTIAELCSSIMEKMSKAAEKRKRLQIIQQKYFELEAKEPPCIVVAEALTRQRAAGKRKNHTRNRRKREWH